jgi:Rad3-related DNA helicase
MRAYIKKKYKKNANIIVHCFTHEIAKNLAENMDCVDDSFLVQSNLGENIVNKKNGHIFPNHTKDEILTIMRNKPNSGITLLSPSMSEGVDFKGDIARGQIVLKNPIPYLGDEYVKAKYVGNESIGIEPEPGYINRMVFTEVSQQYGRVTRSEDDWGITVIIDQGLVNTLKQLMRRGNEIRLAGLNINYLVESIQYKRLPNGDVDFDWPFG